MIAMWLLITIILVGIATIAVINAATFPRLGQAPRPDSQPLVSVLIPARNEADVIETTVRHLLQQTYPDFELIILDDFSDDATAALAESAGAGDPRLTVTLGEPLPPGWLGKNWACQQLARQAKGAWLIFTDADVEWTPHALEAVVVEMNRSQADVLTVWPTQRSQTWAERLVVPLMALAIIGYLPLLLVHYTPWSVFAAANGQCLAFRRQAYQKLGTHKAVRAEVLEDVILARLAKAQGLRLRMVNGANLICCRMYKNWSGVKAGFAKNILAGYGNSVILLGLATIFHWGIFIFPWLWLAFGWLSDALPIWPLWPLALISFGLGIRALTAAVTDQRVADAVAMPISVLLMTIIAGQSVWWQWRYGGPRWKGRTITKEYVIEQVNN